MATPWPKGPVIMPKGKITLQKLAGMIQQGFASMDIRLTSLEDRVTREVGGIRRQISKAIYQPEFDALEHRVEELEREVGIEPE